MFSDDVTMIQAGKYIMAFNYTRMIKIFQDADLMIEKSLCSFTFEGLIFYEFDSNG